MRPVFVNESALIPRVIGGTAASLGEIPYQVRFSRPVFPGGQASEDWRLGLVNKVVDF